MNKTQLREKLKKTIKKRMITDLVNAKGKTIKNVLYTYLEPVFNIEYDAEIITFTDNTFYLPDLSMTDWEFLDDWPYIDFYEKHNIFTKEELKTWKEYLEILKQQKLAELKRKERNQYEILKKKFENSEKKGQKNE